MATVTETTIAQKLEALLKLQTIDSALDNIKKVRGDLPEEVRDLEDEIAGLETRLTKFQAEISSFEEQISNYKISKKDSDKLIVKYKEQQMNVRNNREFEAISKEIEIQGLDVQVSEKKIKEFQFEIKNKTEIYDSALLNLEERKKDLEIKRAELNNITAETEKEESKLIKEADAYADKIEDRLKIAYNRLRGNFKNGLAVVTIERDSCSGCFNQIPPQRQSDIRQRKKIIVCEHCGRILVDETIAEEARTENV
mgnify:CR=1 FL=1